MIRPKTAGRSGGIRQKRELTRLDKAAALWYHSVNARMRTSTHRPPAQRTPVLVEGGEALLANTPRSSRLNGRLPSRVGRARPVQRRGPAGDSLRPLSRGCGKTEVVPRAFALCPWGTEGFLFQKYEKETES